MSEIRRFLRFTLPGLAVSLIGLGLLGLLKPSLVGCIGSDDLFGKLAGIFVASGALGYLLANVYFGIRWIPGLRGLLVIDHKTAINKLDKVLEIHGPSDGTWKLEHLTQFDAWAIITHYCESRAKTEKPMEGIKDICDRTTDVTHGLGALGMGLVVATVAVAMAPVFGYEDVHRVVGIVVSLLVLSCVLWYTFYRSLKALEGISNSAFVTNVMAEHIRKNEEPQNNQEPKKVCIYYGKDDPMTRSNGYSILWWVAIVVCLLGVVVLLLYLGGQFRESFASLSTLIGGATCVAIGILFVVLANIGMRLDRLEQGSDDIRRDCKKLRKQNEETETQT